MASSRRQFLKSAVGVAGGLALAACAPQAATPATPASSQAPAPAAAATPASTAAAVSKRGTITWGVETDVVNLEPWGRTGPANLIVYRALYDGLTLRDADYKLVPGLAESWKLLNDTTWQFKLRSGVKFHNGDPFTAEDVKFSIEASRDPAMKTIFATSFATVARVDIVDPLTVNFVTKAPDGVLPGKLSMYPGYVIPQKYFQKVGYETFNKEPVGTGPYKFKSRTAGVRLELEANKAYWGTPPNADSLVLIPRPELAGRIAALKTGEVNLIDGVNYDQFDDINNSPNAQVVRGKTAAQDMIIVNAKVPPLDNKLIRQALNLSIDRVGLNKALYKGSQRIATGPVLPIEFGFDPSLPPYPYDPEKAKALMQQAKYGNEKILLEYTVRPSTNQLEAVLAEQWKQVGFNIQLGPLDAATRANKLAQMTFGGLFTGSFVSLYGDPDSVIWRTLQPGGSLRYWSNPEFDRLGAEAATSVDQNLRLANYKKMIAMMIDEQPWLSLWDTPVLFATSKSLDFQPGYAYTGELGADRLKFK